MKEQIILDVRSHEEHNQEHIKGSIDMPLSYIESREAKVAKLLK
jgi:rhodanese-related sulfurtransferase